MPDRVEMLIAKLKDANRDLVKASVIEELSNSGDHRAIRPLIEALSDAEVLVRWTAIQGLVKFKEDALGSLLRALDTPDRFLRRNVVQALGEIRSSDIVEKLIKMLMFDESDKNVQIEVVIALYKIGDDRAVEPLITVLKTNDWEMKWRAIHALGTLGGSRTIEPLLDMVNDPDKDIKWAAIMAIEKIKCRIQPSEECERILTRGGEDLKGIHKLPDEKKQESVLLNLTHVESPREIIIKVDGELFSRSVDQFSHFVDGVISSTDKPLALDLSRCSFMDSFALSRLNILRKKMKSKSRPFHIVGMKPALLKIFKITKLDELFDIR